MLHRLHFFVIQTGFVGVIGGRDIRETTNGIMKALSQIQIQIQIQKIICIALHYE